MTQREPASPVYQRVACTGDDRATGANASRFLDRALHLRRARHPGLPVVTRIERGPDGVSAHVEALGGVDLAALSADFWSNGEAIPAGLVLWCLSSALDALACLHDGDASSLERPVQSHGHLAPDCVVLDGAGNVRLGALLPREASARLREEHARSWAAPERLLDASCDGRADIYALALIAWDLLAGSEPAAARRARHLERATANEAALTCEETALVHPAFAGWILRATEAEPARRWATAAQALVGLYRACAIARTEPDRRLASKAVARVVVGVRTVTEPNGAPPIAPPALPHAPLETAEIVQRDEATRAARPRLRVLLENRSAACSANASGNESPERSMVHRVPAADKIAFTLRATGVAAIVAGALAWIWGLLVRQMPSSPWHVQGFASAIDALATHAWLVGLAILVLADRAVRSGLAVRMRLGWAVAAATAAGTLFALTSLAYSARTGELGVQLGASTATSAALRSLRLGGNALLGFALAVACVFVLRGQSASTTRSGEQSSARE